MAVRDSFEGLAWGMDSWYISPRWTIEPKIENIKQALGLFRRAKSIEISLRAKNALNREYDVKIDDISVIMRVAAPADPRQQTVSEVATLHWVHRNMTLPAPRVITYKATRENPVGFEWILMTEIPGKPLNKVWSSIPFAAKKKIVKEIAGFCASSFKNQLKGIGSIYEIPSAVKSQKTGESQPQTIQQMGSPLTALPPEVGRIVSPQFIWSSRIHQDVPRGPFTSSKDYISALIAVVECGCHEILARGGNVWNGRNGVDNATRALDILNRLKPLIPIIFPSTDKKPESTMIFPDELRGQDIFVDNSGVLTGVPDWGFVSALPLWQGCTIPYFLGEIPRYLKPSVRNMFRVTTEPSGEYWKHPEQLEQATLIRKFLEEMRRQEPAWVYVYENSQLQRDFHNAVRHCDGECFDRVASPIKEWINDVYVLLGAEKIRSLEKRIYEH